MRVGGLRGVFHAGRHHPASLLWPGPERDTHPSSARQERVLERADALSFSLRVGAGAIPGFFPIPLRVQTGSGLGVARAGVVVSGAVGRAVLFAAAEGDSVGGVPGMADADVGGTRLRDYGTTGGRGEKGEENLKILNAEMLK